MDKEQIPFTERRIEKALSKIGAKVVKATEMTFQQPSCYKMHKLKLRKTYRREMLLCSRDRPHGNRVAMTVNVCPNPI